MTRTNNYSFFCKLCYYHTPAVSTRLLLRRHFRVTFVVWLLLLSSSVVVYRGSTSSSASTDAFVFEKVLVRSSRRSGTSFLLRRTIPSKTVSMTGASAATATATSASGAGGGGDGKFHFSVDRGGTFTDVFCRLPDGKEVVGKLLSEDPAHYPE